MSKDVLLFTDNMPEAQAEIEFLEGRVTQQFTDSVFVANLPDSVDPGGLLESSPERPDILDPISELAADAWVQLQAKDTEAEAFAPTEGLSWDTPGFSAPEHPEDDPDASKGSSGPSAFAPPDELPQKSTGTTTSLYMIGSVAVGVVIVSGTQSGLGFTTSEQQQVISEVQEGLNFLAGAEPRANIRFVYDIHHVTVSASPGSINTYENAEAPWRNAALQQLGFSASRAGSLDYVADLRARRGTDWAYVAYFTKYPLHHFAYAVTEKVCMEFANDNWGPSLINRVFAHESCHIFGAADEYGSCSCGGSHGYLGVANNNCNQCPGTQVACLMDGNTLVLCQWSRGQIGWDESLFPATLPSSGLYTIQQKSGNRYMDAHEVSTHDYSVVTRGWQNNDTQRWTLSLKGWVYTIQQKSNDRFVDAHESGSADYSVVTRTAQNNDTQRWVFLSSLGGSYTIQQLSNGRFVDAHESSSNDYSVVTRGRQNNDTQRWIVTRLGGHAVTIQQRSNNRFMDAHETSTAGYSVVTRPPQDNDTQRWVLRRVGGVYTIRQRSNGRYMDAHESSSADYSVVTRTAQHNDTQRWVLMPSVDGSYTIQQLSSSRFVDAHETSSADYSVVTRPPQNNDTQRWLIRPV